MAFDYFAPVSLVLFYNMAEETLDYVDAWRIVVNMENTVRFFFELSKVPTSYKSVCEIPNFKVNANDD